mgnify:CR=1 FL=1
MRCLVLPKHTHSFRYRLWRWFKNATIVVHMGPRDWELKSHSMRHHYVMAILEHLQTGGGEQKIANTRSDFKAWLDVIPFHASKKHTREDFLAMMDKEWPFREYERMAGLEPIR